MELTVVQGDITEQDVDAVVNAANRAMRGGGGVDGAIHRAGGPAVLEDCIARFPHGLATGDAGWTTAGSMPARWVIHVVGPELPRPASATGRCSPPATPARSAVADELGARSVAFPLVSAGIYGWPFDDAVDAAVSTLRSTPTRVEEARMVAFGAGGVRRAGGGGSRWTVAEQRPVFVLHDHRKPQPHFDLRLEEDGVLRSWAVPKGLPTDARHDRLAVAVDDHDLDHASYTDATKSIADTGWWELEDRTDQAVRLRAPRPHRRPPLRPHRHRLRLAPPPDQGPTR